MLEMYYFVIFVSLIVKNHYLCAEIIGYKTIIVKIYYEKDSICFSSINDSCTCRGSSGCTFTYHNSLL